MQAGRGRGEVPQWHEVVRVVGDAHREALFCVIHDTIARNRRSVIVARIVPFVRVGIGRGGDQIVL